MKLLLILIAIIFSSTELAAQTQPQEIVKKFFDVYKQKNSDEAIDYLFSNSPYADNIREGIEDVKRQLRKQIGQIGLYYGSDLLTTKTAGSNVVFYTYLVRHAMQPLIFYMMFYKPNTTWQMQSFKMSPDLSDDLEEASKSYRFKENFD